MLRLRLIATLVIIVRLLPGQTTTPVDSIDQVYAFDYPITVTATSARQETPVTYVDLTKKDIAVRNLGQDAPLPPQVDALRGRQLRCRYRRRLHRHLDPRQRTPPAPNVHHQLASPTMTARARGCSG